MSAKLLHMLQRRLRARLRPRAQLLQRGLNGGPHGVLGMRNMPGGLARTDMNMKETQMR